MLNSKDESNLVNNKSYLIKNLKEKIQILKNNNKIIKESIDYNNEIDDFFNKIKQKEEKNNFVLNEYYQGLLNKEKDKKNYNNIKNINLTNNNNKNIINNDINKEKENSDIIENKKLLIQKSNRLQNMMKYILNNQKYKNYEHNNYNTITFKNNKTYLTKDFNEFSVKNNFNNIKLSKYNNAPDINLIVDENNEENIKIIDEDEYTKLKKKNTKSSRANNLTTKLIKLSENNIKTDRDRFNLFGFYINNHNNNFNFYQHLENKNQYDFSPRIILKDSTNKIMPPNEII